MAKAMIESDPNSPNLQLPMVVERNERLVRRRFWGKLRRVAGHLPMARELVATYFCALDPATPPHVKAVLLGALAYFVIPTDMVPDFLAGLGFVDDATVLSTAVGTVAPHIKPRHKRRADAVLAGPGDGIAAAEDGTAEG